MSNKFKYKHRYRHPRENDALAQRVVESLGPIGVAEKARRARAYRRIRKTEEEAKAAHRQMAKQAKV